MPIVLSKELSLPMLSFPQKFFALVKSCSSFRYQLKSHFLKKLFLTLLVYNAAMKYWNQSYFSGYLYIYISNAIIHSFLCYFISTNIPYQSISHTGSGTVLLLIIVVILVPNTIPGTW